MRAVYKRGVIHIFAENMKEKEILKGVKYDKNSGSYIAFPLDYIKMREKIGSINEDVFHPIGYPRLKGKEIFLREYQLEAYNSWEKSGCCGVVVLPTGAGKTVLGLYAISKLLLPTLIVVPTLPLLYQWVEILSEYFDGVGEWSGRRKVLAPITISTYDSAYISAEYLGDKFLFLIADEVHHLPAESYKTIALLSVATRRLGLSATPERQDELHYLLPYLMGPIVFRLFPGDLRGSWLADWEIKEIRVSLGREEFLEYKRLRDEYMDYLRSRGWVPGKRETFLRLLKASSYDDKARRALISLQKAQKISFNARGKIEKVREILAKHQNDKIIIFTKYQDMVYKISEEFLIPAITAETHLDERKEYLRGFSDGKYRAIVTAHVLDEGIDVPDASCAIIVSGTSSQREFIQRIGRVLRPSKPKAIIYEIISNTSEISSSKKRKGSL